MIAQQVTQQSDDLLCVYRKGNGVLFAPSDAQANAALREGLPITIRLEVNDLVLIDEDREHYESWFTGPWIGLVETFKENKIEIRLVDRLNSQPEPLFKENDGEEHTALEISPMDRVVVLRRNGGPISDDPIYQAIS